MRAIIAGGTGFICRRIAADLVSSGYEVLVLSRNAAGSGAPLSGLPGTRLVAWNGRDTATPAQMPAINTTKTRSEPVVGRAKRRRRELCVLSLRFPMCDQR